MLQTASWKTKTSLENRQKIAKSTTESCLIDAECNMC